MTYIEIGYLPKLEFACAEAMNTLATNLSYCGEDVRTILLTSRYAFEGKSFVALNLMRTIASLQKRVVLLDTDLRCSRMVSSHRMRFADGNNGLAHYLAGMCEIEDIVYQTNVENGYFIPIGRKVSSSLQLLSSKRMEKLMKHLSEHFDVVLVDTPPVGIIVDSLEIAKYCDGALLVVGYNRGHESDIKEAVDALEKTGCPVLGAALNNVDFNALTSKKYYYRSERYSSYYNSKYRYGADYSETMSLLRNFFRRIKSLGKKPHSGHSEERRSVRSRSGGSHSAGSHSRGSHTESK